MKQISTTICLSLQRRGFSLFRKLISNLNVTAIKDAKEDDSTTSLNKLDSSISSLRRTAIVLNTNSSESSFVKGKEMKEDQLFALINDQFQEKFNPRETNFQHTKNDYSNIIETSLNSMKTVSSERQRLAKAMTTIKNIDELSKADFVYNLIQSNVSEPLNLERDRYLETIKKCRAEKNLRGIENVLIQLDSNNIDHSPSIIHYVVSAYLDQGKWKDAFLYYKKQLENLKHNILPEFHKGILCQRTINKQFGFLLQQSETEAAWELWKLTESFGKLPAYSTTRHLIRMFSMHEQYDKVAEIFLKTSKIWDMSNYNGFHFQDKLVLICIGMKALLKLKKYEQAISVYQKYNADKAFNHCQNEKLLSSILRMVVIACYQTGNVICAKDIWLKYRADLLCKTNLRVHQSLLMLFAKNYHWDTFLQVYNSISDTTTIRELPWKNYVTALKQSIENSVCSNELILEVYATFLNNPCDVLSASEHEQFINATFKNSVLKWQLLKFLESESLSMPVNICQHLLSTALRYDDDAFISFLIKSFYKTMSDSEFTRIVNYFLKQDKCDVSVLEEILLQARTPFYKDIDWSTFLFKYWRRSDRGFQQIFQYFRMDECSHIEFHSDLLMKLLEESVNRNETNQVLCLVPYVKPLEARLIKMVHQMAQEDSSSRSSKSIIEKVLLNIDFSR